MCVCARRRQANGIGQTTTLTNLYLILGSVCQRVERLRKEKNSSYMQLPEFSLTSFAVYHDKQVKKSDRLRVKCLMR